MNNIYNISVNNICDNNVSSNNNESSDPINIANDVVINIGSSIVVTSAPMH